MIISMKLHATREEVDCRNGTLEQLTQRFGISTRRREQLLGDLMTRQKRADAIDVDERRYVEAGVVPGSPDEPVQSGRIQANLIVEVPIHMSLIPGRARVFDALSNQMIRSDRIIDVKDAISWR